LIPWDLDSVFDYNNWLGLPPWNDLSVDCDAVESPSSSLADVRPACGDPLLRALALYQQNSSDYARALRQLLDEVFDVDAVDADIDEIAQVLESHVEADPDRTVGSWNNGIRSLMTEIELAYADAENRLYDAENSK
jgi:hypothetical protein